MTISFYLQGGLCNLMFQIAAAESLAKRFNATLCYINAHALIPHLEGVCDWTRHAKEYLSIFPNFDLFKNHDSAYEIERNVNVPFRFTQIVPEHGCNYIGYFQCEKNFTDRQFIIDLFKPSQGVLDRVSMFDHLFSGVTCSVHVRRGNYLKLEDYHPVLPMSYYYKAFETLAPFNVDRYLVFSNDIEWCRRNFAGNKFVFVHDTDYVELFLMARCKHRIIANSSFSWWGAYLGEQIDSVIIAPNTWFGSKYPQDHAEDIVPFRWIKI